MIGQICSPKIAQLSQTLYISPVHERYPEYSGCCTGCQLDLFSSTYTQAVSCNFPDQAQYKKHSLPTDVADLHLHKELCKQGSLTISDCKISSETVRCFPPSGGHASWEKKVVQLL